MGAPPSHCQRFHWSCPVVRPAHGCGRKGTSGPFLASCPAASETAVRSSLSVRLGQRLGARCRGRARPSLFFHPRDLLERSGVSRPVRLVADAEAAWIPSARRCPLVRGLARIRLHLEAGRQRKRKVAPVTSPEIWTPSRAR